MTLETDPFARPEPAESWGYTHWPASWISFEAAEPPAVARYRCRFNADGLDGPIRLHASADERYVLLLDGRVLGRGPTRSAPHAWAFESYELTLAPGEHVLEALVWSLGKHHALAPGAQMSLGHGLLLAGEPAACNERLGTGVGAWQVRRELHRRFVSPRSGRVWLLSPGAAEVIDAAADDDDGNDTGWCDVTIHRPGRATGFAHGSQYEHLRLRPSPLPAMLEAAFSPGQVRFAERLAPAAGDVDPAELPVVEPSRHDAALAGAFAGLAAGEPVVVPPHSRVRVLFDFGTYGCVYPKLTTAGGRGSSVHLQFAESLYLPTERRRDKGHRGEIAGKVWHGWGDRFLPDGRTFSFEPLWWRCGRYAQLYVTTAEAPLELTALTLTETRYPLEAQARFDCDDAAFMSAVPIMTRALQMCAHETYFDCPYYEQLMYVGDTRLEALATLAVSADDRLPRRAVELFGQSRTPDGLVQSRYPSGEPQVIPPFALWWVCMLHDLAMWRDVASSLRAWMPTVRSICEAFGGYLNADGLVEGPAGWNFIDWAELWQRDATTSPGGGAGVPPHGHAGVSAAVNLQLVIALRRKAELEAHLGEHDLAARDSRLADQLVEAIMRAFWSEPRRLLSDTTDHRFVSEHVQALAILAGGFPQHVVEAGHAALRHPPAEAARATIYFQHYPLEALRQLRDGEAFFARLELWRGLARHGFVTTPEAPEPSRSDCHAWGAHPLYHTRASILGVRPAGFGFGRVQIEPLLGPLTRAGGTIPHPAGEIAVDVRRGPGALAAEVTLPEGLTGTLVLEGEAHELRPGTRRFEAKLGG